MSLATPGSTGVACSGRLSSSVRGIRSWWPRVRARYQICCFAAPVCGGFYPFFTLLITHTPCVASGESRGGREEETDRRIGTARHNTAQFLPHQHHSAEEPLMRPPPDTTDRRHPPRALCEPPKGVRGAYSERRRGGIVGECLHVGRQQRNRVGNEVARHQRRNANHREAPARWLAGSVRWSSCARVACPRARARAGGSAQVLAPSAWDGG